MAGVHDGLPVLERGEVLSRARAAMICLHGREATAADIYVDIVALLDEPGFAFLAPEAAGNVWYPNPGSAPIESNQPWLSNALEVVDGLLARIQPEVPASRTVILGFSQGACLALEYATRRARRYGAVVGLSGILVGPDDAPRDHAGSLAGTPVLLGSSDSDPYYSTDRVKAAADVLRGLGGDVEVAIYPGMGHIVSPDEIMRVRRLMRVLTRSHQGGPIRTRRSWEEIER